METTPASTPSEKTNWRAYFWEFFMLFLAVFCGFLAEDKLKDKIEKDRAVALANNFYNELNSDATAIQYAIHNRIKKDSAIIYLKKYFSDSSLSHCSKAFVISFNYGLFSNTPSLFEPKEVVLQQLKNAGSLRYFKNTALQKLTGALSVAIANIRQRNEIELSYSQQNIIPFIIKHNDQGWYDKVSSNGALLFPSAMKNYENSGTEIPFYFNNLRGFNKNEALNMIGLYQMILLSTLQNQYKTYDSLNRQLVNTLSKEYHIK